MKKIFLTSLVLLLSISLVACNKNEKINGDDVSLEESLDEEGNDKSFRLDSKLREFIKENIYTTARNNHDTYFSFSQKYDHIDETIEKAKASVDEFKKALEDDESKLTDIEKLKGYSEEEIYDAMIVTFSVYDIKNTFSLPSDYNKKMEKINEQKFEMERRKEDVYRKADKRFNDLYGIDNSKVREEIENKWNELIENARLFSILLR
ncbi:MAG: hypothetical protein MJ245_01645 [Clostridia bacterium]|nr:hypothetical protein [Clostridia bacterium]